MVQCCFSSSNTFVKCLVTNSYTDKGFASSIIQIVELNVNEPESCFSQLLGLYNLLSSFPRPDLCLSIAQISPEPGLILRCINLQYSNFTVVTRTLLLMENKPHHES